MSLEKLVIRHILLYADVICSHPDSYVRMRTDVVSMRNRLTLVESIPSFGPPAPFSFPPGMCPTPPYYHRRRGRSSRRMRRKRRMVSYGSLSATGSADVLFPTNILNVTALPFSHEYRLSKPKFAVKKADRSGDRSRPHSRRITE